jgi:glucose-6-phosphate 1-dehydrogenase
MAELAVENPLRVGLRLSDVPGPNALVIFGGSGDLAHRKLVPALYNLALRGLLPAGFGVVGIGRSDYGGDDGYRESMRESVSKYSRTQPLDETVWASFAEGLCYVRGAFDDSSLYAELHERLGQLDGTRGTSGNAVFYLATPPTAFPTIVAGLGDSGLAQEEDGQFRRLVIEKPFGRDLGSAIELNQQVHDAFQESQVFRIDHYLGKETVQNILVLRFANGIFEPVWNRNFIDHVQIDVPETLALGTRAGFYDAVGAFRDMVVTHLFQILAFVAMEAPTSLEPAPISEEKNKVFRSMLPIQPTDVVRGQYTGYRSEHGVNPESETETFIALRCSIDNWRWAGVPFVLRTGKRLAEGQRIISIAFREPPKSMFPADSGVGAQGPDHLTFDLADASKMSLSFYGKRPGPGMRLDKLSLQFAMHDTGLVGDVLEAYERLILDAMRGDRTLFTTAEGIERLWEVSTPLLEAPPPVRSYAAGSWGPNAIHQLIAPRAWRLPFERAWRDPNRTGA